MRQVIVSQLIGLRREKTKLPRTRDPEFATPKSQEKQANGQGQRSTAKKKKMRKKRKKTEETVKRSTARKQKITQDAKQERLSAVKTL